VAARCGLSRRAVYDAIRRGELPAVRLCSRLRITPEAFDAWLRANAVDPGGTSTPANDAGPPLMPATGHFRALLRESVPRGSS